MLSLYLRRSFQRRPLRHLSLFWVLMCAFLLPLVVSIYRDSMMYGNYLQKMDFSKRQAIHIFGVQPEDVALLCEIDGLTEPYYENRWIYMNFASEEAWDRYSESRNQAELAGLIKFRLAENGRDAGGIDVIFYGYQDVYGIEDDSLLLSRWRQMLILSLALLLFSGLIVQSAYRNHIAAFSPELQELAALGATKGQMIRMFLMIVAIQIVWVQLSSYVRECAPMLRTVYLVGASRRQLKKLIPIWRAAIPAAMLPFLIAVPYAKLRTWLRVGRFGTFLLSLPLATIYALLAALAVLAFLLLVKYALYRIQKKL